MPLIDTPPFRLLTATAMTAALLTLLIFTFPSVPLPTSGAAAPVGRSGLAAAGVIATPSNIVAI